MTCFTFNVRYWLLFVFATLCLGQEVDLLIRDGAVIDGSGAPATNANIGVTGDRITFIGTNRVSAKREIDAIGLIVAPGFIDPHTHYDATLLGCRRDAFPVAWRHECGRGQLRRRHRTVPPR